MDNINDGHGGPRLTSLLGGFLNKRTGEVRQLPHLNPEGWNEPGMQPINWAEELLQPSPHQPKVVEADYAEIELRAVAHAICDGRWQDLSDEMLEAAYQWWLRQSTKPRELRYGA